MLTNLELVSTVVVVVVVVVVLVVAKQGKAKCRLPLFCRFQSRQSAVRSRLYESFLCGNTYNFRTVCTVFLGMIRATEKRQVRVA
jgi:hypothetical protein